MHFDFVPVWCAPRARACSGLTPGWACVRRCGCVYFPSAQSRLRCPASSFACGRWNRSVSPQSCDSTLPGPRTTRGMCTALPRPGNVPR
eukprot:6522576-Prymnesium_polylepis.1